MKHSLVTLVRSSMIRKLNAAVTLVLLGFGLAISLSLYWQEFRRLRQDAEEKSISFSQLWQQSLAMKTNDLRAALSLVCNDQQVVEAFANRDRERLQSLLLTVFQEELKKNNDITQFHWHLPPAVSFLRLHDPDKFGDDLSDRRSSLTLVNQSLRPLQGLEVSKSGPGLKIIRPVVHEQQHLGSVEFAVEIAKILKEVTQALQLEFAVGLKEDVFQDAQCSEKLTTLFSRQGIHFFVASKPIPEQMRAELILDSPEGGEFWNNQLFYCAVPLEDFTGQEVGTILLVQSVTGQMKQLRWMLLRNAVILLLGMLCSMWILNGLVRSLARPIHQMEGVLAALSSGEADLTRRVRVATIDEIGQMAQGFNGFMVKLQAMIRRIMVTAKAMEGAAHGLAETSTTLEQTATSVHLQAETMDQQSIALAGSMDQMNRTAHRAADELSHVAAATEEMTSNLTEVGKQIQHARAVAARAREIALGNEQSSDQLQTRAAEIGSIIDVISTIANQIKLLSFNAAIEAARAGQAGRGFTVVANEVKALSSETAEATMQIVTQIEKIREDSKQSAAGSLAISSVINEMDEIMTILVNAMGEQEAATGQITHSIHDLSEGISVISGNLAGATTHTKEIAKQVSQLADHAEKTKRSAGGTIAATDHLHQLVGSLRALVGQMKINE